MDQTGPETLLTEEENGVPEPVRETLDFFNRHRLWHILGRNPPVRSCREAASMRYRLGKRGIPLRDELRSYLAQGIESAGNKVTVLFHCRGSQSLSFEKIAQVQLGIADISRANVADLGDGDLGYGLVNPFISEARKQAIGLRLQVFDKSVIDGLGQTATMMTNAGSFTWSMEFSPSTLLRALGANAIVADIADEEHTPALSATQGTIGIITGNGPDSGILLWKKVNEAVRRLVGTEFSGDMSYPRVLVHSLPAMGWSMELDARAEPLWELLEKELTLISASGAKTVALACNTTQYFAERIHRLYAGSATRFVRLSDVVRSYIDSTRNESVFALGIGHVTDGSIWSDFRFLRQLQHVHVPNERETEHIEGLAYDIKREGATPKSYQKLKTIIRQTDAENVLLILTELSLLFDAYPQKLSNSKKIVDGMDLYAENIVKEFYS